jgi:HAD superfamily hydrolase (TIGR01549 family)
MFKHVWFDVERTITVPNAAFERAHDHLLYQTFSEVRREPDSKQLRAQYQEMYERLGTVSAVFRSLGKPAGFWHDVVSRLDRANLYDLRRQRVVKKVVGQIRQMVPVSLFTNLKIVSLKETLSIINLPEKWFTHLLTGDDVRERKPDLEGFYKIIKLSRLKPAEILYVGDRERADIIPAKKVGLKTCLVYRQSKVADYSAVKFEDLLKVIS